MEDERRKEGMGKEKRKRGDGKIKKHGNIMERNSKMEFKQNGI